MGQVSANYNQFAALLTVVSYFSMRNEVGKEERVEYQILQCTQPLEILKESMRCAWDDTGFYLGETVVIGTYLFKCGKTPNNIVCIQIDLQKTFIPI